MPSLYLQLDFIPIIYSNKSLQLYIIALFLDDFLNKYNYICTTGAFQLLNNLKKSRNKHC